MEKLNLNRWSTYKIKNKTIQNRVVIPSMASGTASDNGIVSSETINHYSKLAQVQPGILIVEYSYVQPSGRSETNQLGIHDDTTIDGLSKIAKIIKDKKSLAGIQLTHAGGKSEKILTGGELWAPCSITVPVKNQKLESPTAMEEGQINEWKSAFLMSATRAVMAGFDLVEIHAAHGYGINQWLSPITNKRTDLYGTNAIGRSRLLIEIIKLIRERFPELIISVRIPGVDFIEKGMSLIESIDLAINLQNNGVDIINVSSGIGGWRRPTDRIGQGYLVNEAKEIKAHLHIPVIGVGGITSGDYIDRGIQNNDFTFAAVGRAILNNPQEWFEHNLKIF